MHRMWTQKISTVAIMKAVAKLLSKLRRLFRRPLKDRIVVANHVRDAQRRRHEEMAKEYVTMVTISPNSKSLSICYSSCSSDYDEESSSVSDSITSTPPSPLSESGEFTDWTDVTNVCTTNHQPLLLLGYEVHFTSPCNNITNNKLSQLEICYGGDDVSDYCFDTQHTPRSETVMGNMYEDVPIHKSERLHTLPPPPTLRLKQKNKQKDIT